MARSLVSSFLLLAAIASTTSHGRLGSQMYSSGIPSSFRELLKPGLNNMECPRKNVIYHDPTILDIINYVRSVQISKRNLSFFLEEDLFYQAIASTTSHGRLGSQMYSSGIPSSFRELLKPVLNNMECPRKNVIYHDITFAILYAYKPSDAVIPIELQISKNNLSFFLEEDLFSGNPLKVMLDTTGALPECAYLPRRIVDSIPFSSDHFDDILSDFSTDPNSADAIVIKDTLEICERPALTGHEKTCTTSLEAMEEMAVETLGEGAKALSTKMEANSAGSRTYRVQRVELKGKKYMSCHRLSYPYAVHLCHKIRATVVYETSLVRDDGVVGDALVVCHRDTSHWEPNFFAFERLNVKPGKGTICHLFPKGHLLWLAPDQEARIEQVV